MTLPYQRKYWNNFIFQFYYHSTHVKIPKINSFLPIQLLNILLLNFTHIFIFKFSHFVSLFVHTVVTFSLVFLSSDLLLSVSSFPCNHMLDIIPSTSQGIILFVVLESSRSGINLLWGGVVKLFNTQNKLMDVHQSDISKILFISEKVQTDFSVGIRPKIFKGGREWGENSIFLCSPCSSLSSSTIIIFSNHSIQ